MSMWDEMKLVPDKVYQESKNEIDRLTTENERLRGELERVDSALHKYGWHLDTCPKADLEQLGQLCGCGFEKALEETVEIMCRSKLVDFVEELEKELEERYKFCEDHAATPSSILLAVLNAVAGAKVTARIG